MPPVTRGAIRAGITRSIPAVVVAAVLIGTLVAPASAQSPASSAVVVRLDVDGDAEVSLVQRFDLANESERRAFDRMRGDDRLQTQLRDQFGDRMRGVIDAAANESGRPMSAGVVRFEAHEVDSGATGVIELAIAWNGLAAVDGDRLVVAEPFAGGFTPEQAFVLDGPEGYEAASLSHEPDVRDGATLQWAPGTPLDGFRVVYAPGGDGRSSTTGQPGFGLAAAGFAIAASLGIALSRWRS